MLYSIAHMRSMQFTVIKACMWARPVVSGFESARRYDLLLKADQPVGVYWMRSATQVTLRRLRPPRTRC